MLAPLDPGIDGSEEDEPRPLEDMEDDDDDEEEEEEEDEEEGVGM
jgi:hypothetical protein